MDSKIIKYVPKALKKFVKDCYNEDGAYVVEFDEHVFDSVMESREQSKGCATIFADTVRDLRSMLSLCEVI